MAGQSANLSLKEARAMQMRVQHSGSHANNNGGSGGKRKSMSMETMKKMPKMKSKDC